MSTTQVTLPIKGMHCGSCAKMAERALRAVPGVTSVEVQLLKEQAIVSFEPERANVLALRQAIESQGYSCPVTA